MKGSMYLMRLCSRDEWPVNKTYRRLMADHDVLAWINAIKAAQGVVSLPPEQRIAPLVQC
jgi:hypothetical protein